MNGRGKSGGGTGATEEKMPGMETGDKKEKTLSAGLRKNARDESARDGKSAFSRATRGS